MKDRVERRVGEMTEDGDTGGRGSRLRSGDMVLQ